MYLLIKHYDYAEDELEYFSNKEKQEAIERKREIEERGGEVELYRIIEVKG